jgi:hypothetical protein
VSVHLWGAADAPAGRARRALLRAYADLGVARVILQGFAAVSDPGVVERAAEDGSAVGLVQASDPEP